MQRATISTSLLSLSTLATMGRRAALHDFDHLYPQDSGESALQQLEAQLSNPLPYDLTLVRLDEYKHLILELQDWQNVKRRCADVAMLVFDRVSETDQNVRSAKLNEPKV